MATRERFDDPNLTHSGEKPDDRLMESGIEASLKEEPENPSQPRENPLTGGKTANHELFGD